MEPADAKRQIQTLHLGAGGRVRLGWLKTALVRLHNAAPYAVWFLGALGMLECLRASAVGLGILIIVSLITGLAFGLAIYFLMRRAAGRVKPSIYLDIGVAQTILDQHFKDFVPTGDISILQTWIPASPLDAPNGNSSQLRILKWADYLTEAIVKNKKKAKRPVRLRVLLLGSEEVLRNRVRYRWDLAQAYGFDYPLQGRDLNHIVAEKKRHIDNIERELLSLEACVRQNLADEKVFVNFAVSIRYYRVTPCGPVYIFGDQALLAGFYDHRWTSDQAPAVRLVECGSAEWAHFSTQFECVWKLRDPNPAATNATTLATTCAPSWRPGPVMPVGHQ